MGLNVKREIETGKCGVKEVWEREERLCFSVNCQDNFTNCTGIGVKKSWQKVGNIL